MEKKNVYVKATAAVCSFIVEGAILRYSCNIFNSLPKAFRRKGVVALAVSGAVYSLVAKTAVKIMEKCLDTAEKMIKESEEMVEKPEDEVTKEDFVVMDGEEE